jgi:transcriptional regulator with XRE-family HTH domain
MRTDDFFAEIYAKHPEIHAIAAEVDPPFILAANVIDLRRERGLTQAALAEKAGIAQPRIAEIEAGDANPRLRTLTRLAVALEVTVGDLLRPPPDFVIAPHESAEGALPKAEASAEPAPRRKRAG